VLDWRWKQQCPYPKPEAFIFPNKEGDFMDIGNYRNRVLHKFAAELEFPKLTFQVAHNCDAGPEEGYGEGRARRAPALSRGNHDGCAYAGDSEERAGDAVPFSPSNR
jgi:hypothetical protein